MDTIPIAAQVVSISLLSADHASCAYILFTTYSLLLTLYYLLFTTYSMTFTHNASCAYTQPRFTQPRANSHTHLGVVHVYAYTCTTPKCVCEFARGCVKRGCVYAHEALCVNVME